ncbi:MAG: hypothetical protein PHD06_11365 [Bacteroidales bacterium]|nr:hypothetical protein [Bacteroidales bacterium]
MITVEIARQHLKLTTTLEDANFTPFIPDALERYLRPFLGDTVIDNLWDVYNSAEDTELTEQQIEDYTALLAKVQPPLARFTFLVAAPSLDINVGQQGFTTAGSGNLVPASEARVKRFTESIERLGWDGVETLLRYLFANKDKFTPWTASDAYKAFTRGFIRSAERFNSYADIDGSYLKFYRLNQSIALVETLQVEPLLGSELFAALKAENIAGTKTNVERVKAIDLTCKAIALLTMVAEDPTKYSVPANHIYNMLRDHLNANPTDFPELFPSGADSQRAPYSEYENDGEKGFFVFGG